MQVPRTQGVCTMISNNTRLRSDGVAVAVAVAWKEWEESELETDRPNPGPIQVRSSVRANWGGSRVQTLGTTSVQLFAWESS